MVTLSICWYLCPQTSHIISFGVIWNQGIQNKVKEDWIIGENLFDFFTVLNPGLQTAELVACVSLELHSYLLVHTGTSFYVYKILSKHFFLDWLCILILWTFSIIFCSNWSFSSFSIAMYLHPHPASFQLSRKAKLTAWELRKRLTDTTRPQITGSESLTGWGELKLWEVFVVLIKLFALLVFPVYLSLNMSPWNCKCKRQNRLLKLSVCVLKTNHTLPAREGNWQTQSAWNLCKAGSKVRSDENISLQPVC